MTSKTSPFRELFRLFQDRFLESDSASPDAGFGTNLYQVLGSLATPGLFLALYSLPLFGS